MRPYEYKDNVHISISYEFDLNLYRIDREVYNVLDCLGDIGGLADALLILAAFCMMFFTLIRGDELQSYILENVYKTEPRQN